MNVLILEDEAAAAKQMQQLLEKNFQDLRIVAVLESVRSARSWLQINPAPDLIISDIQLADGNCFELFRDATLTAPVIFTTAYDEYMQQAFKLHSVDYLLKPIDEQELKTAVEKYSRMQQYFQQHLNEKLVQILNERIEPPKKYKTRFLIKTGERLSTVPVDDVALLLADDRIVFLYDGVGHKFILDESLDDLEKLLDPVLFFRLNRKYIVPISSIEKIQHHFNGKLHVSLKKWNDTQIFISREKAKAFKTWLGGH